MKISHVIIIITTSIASILAQGNSTNSSTISSITSSSTISNITSSISSSSSIMSNITTSIMSTTSSSSINSTITTTAITSFTSFNPTILPFPVPPCFNCTIPTMIPINRVNFEYCLYGCTFIEVNGLTINVLPGPTRTSIFTTTTLTISTRTTTITESPDESITTITTTSGIIPTLTTSTPSQSTTTITPTITVTPSSKALSTTTITPTTTVTPSPTTAISTSTSACPTITVTPSGTCLTFVVCGAANASWIQLLSSMKVTGSVPVVTSSTGPSTFITSGQIIIEEDENGNIFTLSEGQEAQALGNVRAATNDAPRSLKIIASTCFASIFALFMAAL